MIDQTVFSFKLDYTREQLTAHSGLALMAEFNHGIGLRELVDKYLPQPQSNSMNKTNKAFRLAIKREKREQGDLFENRGEHYFYHAIATNWESEMKDTHHVIAWHNQRGQAENFNKELKSSVSQ